MELTTRFGCTIRKILDVTGTWDDGNLTITAIREVDGKTREYHISWLRHKGGLKVIMELLKPFYFKETGK